MPIRRATGGPEGLPDQHAHRMSLSLAAALDAWLNDAYLTQEPPPTMPQGDRYIAEARVDFNPTDARRRRSR